MEAFHLALLWGADVLETDVRLSRDKQVVVIHDARVDRTCNGRGAVSDLTLRALKQLDAGYHFTDLNGRRSRGDNVGLTSLAELLEHFPATRINIDIKDNCYEAENSEANLIQHNNRPHNIKDGSFQPNAVDMYRQIDPHIKTNETQVQSA
ncbi:MAG: glycerophosphodiester phosphodiesterase family protein, partial [Granulosicoccus sp.]